MTQRITPDEAAGLLRPGTNVLIPGCAGESLLFAETLKANPQACAGVSFLGVLIPGVNRTDYAAFHDTAHLTVFFANPDIAESMAAGKADFRPLHFTEITPYLRERAKIDVALIQVSPAMANGEHSLGVGADFVPSILDVANHIVAHVNPNMPAVRDGPSVPATRLDYVVEQPHALLQYDLGRVPDTMTDLGRNIASLIGDGDTIQIGLGKIQAAVLGPLHDRKNLRLHGGMISNPLRELLEAGAFARRRAGERPPVTTGVALGTSDFYAYVGDSPDISFRPVTHTHDIGVLSDIDNFVAINSSIEVDLLGQANAEMVRGRQVSAAGGLVDFMRGARRSKGGRAVLALASTTSDGKTSRIVPALAPGTAVTCSRYDIDFVVTENGVADLRDTTPTRRAEALIDVAAPQFRDELGAALVNGP